MQRRGGGCGGKRARTCSLPLPPNTGPLRRPLQVIPQGGNENQDTYTRASNYAAQADEVAARITGITPYYPPPTPTHPGRRNLPVETVSVRQASQSSHARAAGRLWTVEARKPVPGEVHAPANQEMMLWKAQCLEKHADVVAALRQRYKRWSRQ